MAKHRHNAHPDKTQISPFHGLNKSKVTKP